MPSAPPIHRPHGQATPRQRKALYDKNRPSRSKRGYTRQWYKARAIYLNDHPLCAECTKKDRITAATEVDHIIPHRGDMELFWDETNWQSLCKPCHSAKTMRELNEVLHAPL